MIEIASLRSPPLLLLLASISFQLIAADVSSASQNGTKVETQGKSSSSGSVVVGVLLAIVLVVFLCFFLYKLWQKKKRDEQYARLLKLFEEDDELEVELGLRD